ncbi:ATP-binding protein [bacterium 1xD42-67]|nr:ATP-binding protein [bacterium 1xD42-67]
MSSKLFTFNRSLPAPFNKVGKKVKVSSTYGDGTEATLSTTVVKAVLAFCACKDGDRPGAVGTCGQKGVAEYKSAAGADAYHLAVYDPTNGSVLASKYDSSTEMMETYSTGKTGQDGAAILLAMIPALMADKEFKETLDAFMVEYRDSFSNLSKATDLMAILCDNAYRRVNDKTCSAHLPVTIDNSGNVMRVSQTHLDSGSFRPDQVFAGEFTILAHTGAPIILEHAEAVPHSDFVGKYTLSPGRVLSAREQALVPVLEPWYVLPEEVVSICTHALKSTEKALPMRNFLLRGPAGTGKTEGAKAIAAGLNLPYMKYTCSANTEVYDFIGQVFPDTDGPSTGDANLDRERQELTEMGGITYENVKKIMGLPDLDDMDYDPEGTYQQLTGRTKPGATSQDCMAEVMCQVTNKIQQLCKVDPETASAGQTYTYIETDFIRALKYGYLVEIQEPTTIMQPGVLVGLNSLLEQNGTITLPTGEVIRRHPDAVVVVTTNVSYEGCRGMNQSVLDRMNLTQDIELPTPEIMAQRAMSITGCEDDYQISRMVQVVNDMSDFCRKNGISDGSCGMRSLIDWVMSAEITGDPYTSALYTIISKATADEEDREAIITSVLEPIFPPMQKKAV